MITGVKRIKARKTMSDQTKKSKKKSKRERIEVIETRTIDKTIEQYANEIIRETKAGEYKRKDRQQNENERE